MVKYDFLNHSIIAHRGIYNNINIYENTLESIMYAVKNDLSVEIDIRLTKDNEIIVFHDDDMTRLLKLKDKVNSISITDLDYISHYHIPRLKEVLENVNGKVPIIIDVKEDSKIIRDQLFKLMNEYKGPFAIQSFNPEILKYFKKKKFVVGLLLNKKDKDYLDKDYDVDFLSIKYDILDKLECNRLKEKYYLIGWTIDNKEDVNLYIKYFNNLIIDNIEEVFR